MGSAPGKGLARQRAATHHAAAMDLNGLQQARCSCAMTPAVDGRLPGADRRIATQQSCSALDASAMFVGRLSMNQPAIGHVGVRQPYDVPVTPFHAGHVPGDSTSGSGSGGGGGGGRAGSAERCGQV